MNKSIILVISLVLLVQFAQADLPVHCLKKQIVGDWVLQLSDVVSEKEGEMVSCGHNAPDNEKTSWKAMRDGFDSKTEFQVNLQENDQVSGNVGGSQHSGKWTMIYDEGFEINIADYSFFTFSKYESDNVEFKSVCDQTLVGWYNNNGKKGCYKGYKPTGDGKATENTKQDKVVQPKEDQAKTETKTETTLIKNTETKSENTHENVEINIIDEQQANSPQFISRKESITEPLDTDFDIDFALDMGMIMTQTKSTETKHKSSHLKKNSNKQSNLRKNKEENLDLHKGFIDHQKVVDRLNTVQKSWTAKVPEEFKEFNIEQMNSRAGRIRNKAKLVENPFAQQSFVQTSSNADSYKNYAREDLSGLPLSFDWSEKLERPRQQKDCGSCYAIATSAMITSRLKIHHNEDVVISPQHSLDCNFYNQGCDGGYGFLVSKFGSEYDMVPESCHPYKAQNGHCSNSCDVSMLKKTYKISEYKYLGGAYGRSSEKQMMEEMQENGPIVISFEPAYDFMYYSEGIYHSVDAEDWLKNGERQPAWEKVDHSVLAYGWGEENGEKYWMVQNSWGEDWGENGTFRIRRGTDESHVESMGEAAYPYVIEH